MVNIVVSGKKSEDSMANREKLRSPTDCITSGSDRLDTMPSMPNRAKSSYNNIPRCRMLRKEEERE